MNAIVSNDVFMQTSKGLKFYLSNPRFDIEEIATALSKQCRYGGHTKDSLFYSVAEHCVHIANYLADFVSFEMAYNGLMHDFTEAYLVDIPRPIKRLLNDYVVIENDLYSKGAVYFGLSDPIPDRVKSADNRILVDEKAQIMAHGLDWESTSGLVGLGVTIKCWTPERACAEFLDCFATFKPRD